MTQAQKDKLAQKEKEKEEKEAKREEDKKEREALAAARKASKMFISYFEVHISSSCDEIT